MGAFTCAECGKVGEPGAEGWKAHLDQEHAVSLFCPQCAQRAREG